MADEKKTETDEDTSDADAGTTPDRIDSAAVCRRASMVVCTSWPSVATTRFRSRAWLPCRRIAWTT